MMRLLALLSLTAALYWPMRENGYVYEDQVTVDASIARGNDLAQMKSLSGVGLSLDLSRLSIWATARTLGNTPFQHHRVNLVLHLINGTLVAGLLVAMGANAWGWTLGAALFLTHGIQTEAVALVASRSALLSATFMLAALLIAVYRPLNQWRAFVVFGIGVLAMMAKQDAVLLVLLLPLLAWRSPLKYVASIVGVWGLAMGYAAWHMATRGEAMALPFTGITYVAYQLAAFWNLVSVVVWPFGRLTIDYDIGNLPIVIAYLSVLTAILVVGVGLVLRALHSPVGAALLWPFVILLPRVAVRLPEWFSAHQFYLVMPALSLLLALAITHLQTSKGPIAWAS